MFTDLGYFRIFSDYVINDRIIRYKTIDLMPFKGSRQISIIVEVIVLRLRKQFLAEAVIDRSLLDADAFILQLFDCCIAFILAFILTAKGSLT